MTTSQKMGSDRYSWKMASTDILVNIVAKTVFVFESLISGAIAGAVSKTVIAPGDRVKIIYQVDPSRPFTFTNAIKTGKKIVEHGGISALWTGNGATMMRVAPYASITFMSFEHYNDGMRYLLGLRPLPKHIAAEANHHLSQPDDQSETRAVVARFCSGSLAGATATTCTYPLDLLRARFAAHNDPLHPRYPSYYLAIKEISQGEGWRLLYRGLFPTVAGIVPYAGSNFAVFETLKHRLSTLQGLPSEHHLPTYQRLLAGGFSGLIAQSLTYPLDIVRRRMQVSPQLYPGGVLKTLSTIYKTEGLKQGLLKGLAMNWIKGPIATSISFTVHDKVKIRIRDYNAVQSQKEKDRRKHVDKTSDSDQCSPLIERLICGGLAGFFAKLWTAPFDRLKIMYAVGLHTVDEHGYKINHIYNVVKEMLGESPHMWQGSGAMMARVIPYAAVTYTSFEYPFRKIGQRLTYSTQNTFLSDFVGGALAASLATVLLHPIDLLRVRSAASFGPRYLSYGTGLKGMVRRGGVASLFEGVTVALIGIAPLAGLGFAIYEGFKQNYLPPSLQRQYTQPKILYPKVLMSSASPLLTVEEHRESESSGARPNFLMLMLVGSLAGIIGQAITYPLNIVRRRAMVDDIVYEGLIISLKELYISKGFYSGLYDRMPLGWVVGAMTIGLSFAINDELKYVTAEAHRQQTLIIASETLRVWAQPLFIFNISDHTS